MSIVYWPLGAIAVNPYSSRTADVMRWWITIGVPDRYEVSVPVQPNGKPAILNRDKGFQ
jgi:hypothetical protein